MPAASRPVARLRTPAELLAAVPLLCGFVPAASLVLLCLAGPRHRLVLTARVDLPAEGDEARLVADLVRTVERAGAQQVVLGVWSDAAGARPHRTLVHAVRDACGEVGVEVADALLVRNGRWWSYACLGERCCPADGTPLPSGGPGVELLAAAGALDGRAVLPSRQDLAASVSGPAGDDACAAVARLDEATGTWQERVAVDGRARAVRAALAAWRRALAADPAHPPQGAGAAELVTALADVGVRDEVLTWALEDGDQLLGLLLHLARGTPAPHDAALCTVLAWTAYARGDGALANVALDRALATDPGCSLALLARQALDAAVLPAQVRAVLVATRDVLGHGAA